MDINTKKLMVAMYLDNNNITIDGKNNTQEIQRTIFHAFSLELEQELFLTEIRSTDSLTLYLVNHLENEWFTKNRNEINVVGGINDRFA